MKEFFSFQIKSKIGKFSVFLFLYYLYIIFVSDVLFRPLYKYDNPLIILFGWLVLLLPLLAVIIRIILRKKK